MNRVIAGTSTLPLGQVVFSNSNGYSFGLSGSTMTLGGAGAGITGINVSGGSTSQNLTNVVFANANGVSFGLDGSTVTARHNGQTVTHSRSFFPDHNFTINNGIGSGMGQNSLSVAFLPCPNYVSGSRVHMFASIAVNGGSNSTGAWAASGWLGFYSRTGGTLTLVSSGSQTFSGSWSSNTTSVAGGPKRLSVPMNVNMTPGDYWAAFVLQTASSNLTHNMTMFNAQSMHSLNSFGDAGFAGAMSQASPPCIGIYSATTNAPPVSIAFSEVTMTGTAFQRANIVFEVCNETVW